MLVLRRSRQLRARPFAGCRKFLATQSHAAVAVVREGVAAEEYATEPQYPEIRDVSFKGRKLQTEKDWHEQLRNVPTIEEKMIKINMPRYYGYKMVDFNDTFVPYNALPLTQHYTRTMLEELPKLVQVGEGKEQNNQQMDAFVEAARSDVSDALEYAHDYYKNKIGNSTSQLDGETRERQLTQIVVEQLHRTLQQTLAADFPHLQELEVDINPRHEAFWAVGGIDPPKNVVKAKKGQAFQKDYVNDPVDRLVQYTGSPFLALRHRLQLPAWQSFESSADAELAKQLPRYNYDARTIGYTTKHQHAINLPGHWPDSACAFGFLSFQSRTHLLQRPAAFGVIDQQEALHAQAIQAAYAWLLAQANYQGFNTYNELTYPLNTQTIITNGRDWSFYEYQLNTVLVHGAHVDINPRVNHCRGTLPLRLYDGFTPEGKCQGLNDVVIRHLLHFYMNAPSVQRTPTELQPYVAGPTLRRLTDYAEPEQREFLERCFKHLASKRSRHLELPEIYLWEKLYKIDNKTRPLEARRRFFEVGINPWKRTLDQHDKEYIPRKERPGGPKSRDKHKKTYYP